MSTGVQGSTAVVRVGRSDNVTRNIGLHVSKVHIQHDNSWTFMRIGSVNVTRTNEKLRRHNTLHFKSIKKAGTPKCAATGFPDHGSALTVFSITTNDL